MATPAQLRAASAALARLDPVMASLAEAHGPVRLRARPPVAGRFEALARAVAFQQLAGAAAETIWRRTRALTPSGFTPGAVLALGPDGLRPAGLSAAKAASIVDLARRADDGSLPLDRLGRLPDDEVVTELVQVRGIGPWTAQMFLIFSLHRLDVWPSGDLGVANGYARAYGVERPVPSALDDLGERFRPHRSLAAWYCWRAADTRTPDPR